jgi:effector-binding domain-containing protein
MQIETKPVFHALGVRRTCTIEALSEGGVMDEICNLAIAQALSESLTPTAGFALTYKYDAKSNSVEFIGGILTDIAGKGKGEVEYVTQPERLALVADLVGSYDGLHAMYQKMMVWAKENNKELLMPPCEFYLSDPSKVSDPSEFHTQIVWPIKG